jgi:hypothetical protein
MKKRNKQIDRSSMLLAFLYSIFIALPIYGFLGNAYYVDFINGFAFLGALIVIMVVTLIFLIIFREDKFKRLVAFSVIVVLLLFWGYEIRLLNYESHTYIADGYKKPEELLEESGIHILTVGMYDVHYLENEDMARDNYVRNGIQIFDLYKINNRDRYTSKTHEIKQFLGFGKDDFQVMGENVRSFAHGDITFINEFLSGENLSGNSAGLALGLTAMIHQGNLENALPIGVTGTLEPNGDVTQVGGIKVKMMISEQSGFPFIIVPMANAEEAETVKSQQDLEIEILPVRHINEAVQVIKELNDSSH